MINLRYLLLYLWFCKNYDKNSHTTDSWFWNEQNQAGWTDLILGRK